MDKLRRAADTMPCVCGGIWEYGALTTLEINGIRPLDLCRAVVNALKVGARRGSNVALLGPGGCGKSSLFEPLEQIFKTAEKPQGGSSFPLVNVLDCDVLLWQDYLHDEQTLRFTDLLSLFVGESVGIRVVMTGGNLSNVKHRNRAPAFITGRGPIRFNGREVALKADYEDMMADRFTVFSFRSPIPRAMRQQDFPQCGPCCARFFLHGDYDARSDIPARHGRMVDGHHSTTASPTPMRGVLGQHQQRSVVVSSSSASSSSDPWQPPVPPGRSSVMVDLEKLVRWRESGSLSDAEFAAAKRRLLSGAP